MNTSPNSAARKAQEALGLRLRGLRKDAGLTGRALADATGWHFTRVSKIENGVQAPTDLDIRVWCAACDAEDQAADLIAQARTIQYMYMEFRHRTRAGMKERLGYFADEAGYELAGVFIEEIQTVPVAFQRLVEAVVLDKVEFVIIPTMLHFMTLGSPNHIRQHFEAATGAKVLTVTETVSYSPGEPVS